MVRKIDGGSKAGLSAVQPDPLAPTKKLATAKEPTKRPEGGYDDAQARPLSLSGRYKAAPLPPGATKADLAALIAGQRALAQAGAGATGAAGGATKSKGGLVGTTLLTANAAGERVTATKVLGSQDGYGSRYEAIAAARMTGSDTAFVVQKNGRFYAVEGDKSGVGNSTSSENGLQGVEALPPWDEKAIARLRADLKQALADGDGDKVKKLRLELATSIFGVKESEIAFTRSPTERKAGKINILDLPQGTLGEHGPENDGGEEFMPGKSTAIEIDRDLLMGPDYPKKGQGGDALGVLFHESSHQRDYELARQWVATYEKETGKQFSPSKDGDLAFTTWADKRVRDTKKKPALSRADMLVVVDATRRGVNGNTEARAYLGSFLGALEAGSPAAARDQLLTWAKGQPSRIPPAHVSVENELFRKLETAYRQMPKDQRAAFDAALDEAKALPNSPLKRFDHKTALKLP